MYDSFTNRQTRQTDANGTRESVLP